MTAGAAVVSQVYRERNARRSRYTLKPRPPPNDPDMAVQSVKPACLPCVKGPWLLMLLCIGFMVLGGYLCNLSFHAEYHSMQPTLVNNHTVVVKDMAKFRGLKSLTYIGPTFIGVGAFTIIICCVVLFDLREKRMKTLLQIKLESQQGLSMEYTNRLILDKASERQEKARAVALVDITDQITSAINEKKRQSADNEEDIEKLSDPPAEEPKSIPQSPASVHVENEIPENCEQMNKIATISQPTTPAKLQLESPSKLPPYTEEHTTRDKWFPLMRLTALANDQGRIIKKKRKQKAQEDNSAFQESNYDLQGGNASSQLPPDYDTCVLTLPTTAPNNDNNNNIPHVYVNEITPSQSGHSMQSGSRQSSEKETYL